MQNNAAFDDFQPVGRSWFRSILKIVVLALCVLLTIGGSVYYLALQKPDFYQQSMAMSDHEAFEAGEALEVAALYLRNDVIEEEAWVAEFKEGQINGWLASDLPRKFSKLLPDEVRGPRVGIDPGEFRIALATEIKGIETVLVAALEFFPTGVSNEFGLRVLGVHAGWLPIPVSFFTEPASELLQDNRIKVQWYDDDGGLPVALLTVPESKLRYEGKKIVVEQLEIADGSVRLSGRSEPVFEKSTSATDAQPDDPETVVQTTELLPVGE
jgi:hypothetical protein